MPNAVRRCSTPATAQEARRIRVAGTIQGVGFRPWMKRRADALGLVGWVGNCGPDAVVIEALGTTDQLERLLEAILREPPAGALVDRVVWERAPLAPRRDFQIAPSLSSETDGGLALVPDLATCPHCLKEILSTESRRSGYPFTTCCACGPRFTIVRSLPYDRRHTTLRDFPLCDECQAEFTDSTDRRYHAEAMACPRCGPTLTFLAPDGSLSESGSRALEAATRTLLAGAILAVKGIGGFHLACDATQDAAVAKLRARKQRAAKPFAVMVRDLTEAESLARCTPTDCTQLVSSERPIVVVSRWPMCRLAPSIAPDTAEVGLMLPYSPLHHLLLQAVPGPLVMTSGNRSGEPIVYEDGAALRSLAPLCDGLLTHDRPIIAPCDDSVVRSIAGGPTLLRRSRGHVPRPVRLASTLERPVLACGAHFNNTVCLGVGDRAYLSAHQGELDSLESLDRLRDAVRHLENLLGVTPEVIAHDLHPLYASTAFAREHSAALRIGVQHHHAHVATAMVEHGLTGPVHGVAFDGTGYGLDGTAWGGEFLAADFKEAMRLATLRPVLLAGGDAAVREPWRVALAVLLDAFEGAPPLERLPLFNAVSEDRLRGVRALLTARTPCSPAHGAGRYFDAVAALVLERTENQYQGHLATLWGSLADPKSRRAYSYDIDTSHTPWTLDLRATFRDIVDDLLGKTPAATISGRFHHTLAAAICDVLKRIEAADEPRPIVLTGGCFQNAGLVERVLEQWDGAGAVFTHRTLPPGDGGIAVGQTVIADASGRSGEIPPCA